MNGGPDRPGDGGSAGTAAAEQATGAAPPGERHTTAALEAAAAEGWSLRELERAYILHLLARHDGHRGQTAEALGIDRRTLYRKLKEYEAEAR